MQITRKDVGYTIYSRLEENIRFWLSERLLTLFGNEWLLHIPKGIWDKCRERSSFLSEEEVDSPMLLFDETDMPDLTEIIFYKKTFSLFISTDVMTAKEFRNKTTKLYEIRNKIAHIKRNFSALDLDLLIDITKSFFPVLGAEGSELSELLDCIEKNPEKVIIKIPSCFFVSEDQSSFIHINNIPAADYDPDGGFIGRKEELKKILTLILGDLHRVVTIAGAGGVGKTAIAHKLCNDLLEKSNFPFDGIVWVSAKQEKMTVTGIEPIESRLLNYEEILDSILKTFGFQDSLNESIEKKKEDVEIILQAGDKGVLVVVDNLETIIQDERVVEFIKDFPPPSKVLITSRLGLGEVERRYPLKEMNTMDAVLLLRTIAREKGADSFARMPDPVLSNYANKM